MSSLRCAVFRGLPKELEEEINKFLETTPCHVHFISQSESANHVTATILYELAELEQESDL
jgi:hypothetical protein